METLWGCNWRTLARTWEAATATATVSTPQTYTNKNATGFSSRSERGVRASGWLGGFARDTKHLVSTPILKWGKMLMCDRGVQMLITTVGAFAAFSLMTIAVGTDYWLYSRGVCRVKSNNENETSRKNEEVMTHSGLWRTCCLEGKPL